VVRLYFSVTRAIRRLIAAGSFSYTAGVMGVCLAGWLPCLVLHAQEARQSDRPVIQLDGQPEQRDVPGFAEAPTDPATENVRRVFLEMRLAEGEPVRGLTFEATVKGSDRKVHLHYATLIANGDVADARVVETGARYDVAVTLSPDGAEKMASATSRHLGRPLAIILDGEVVAVLTVRKALAGEIGISAGFTQADAIRIVAGLKKW
jgi:preprotein translocase subunit SecD